ncbi:MAG: helix-turn-helix domain-containing protein [Omnitrophica bacterium]|nr:helix-turn-helix domain-containing protein [Candidatus Omnitrophota bacterium]
MPEKLITVKEVAALLGIPRTKIRELVASGELPAYKVGGKFIRFRREQVEAIRQEIRARIASTTPISAPREEIKILPEAEYSESYRDRIRDFFYFNDFYLACAGITLIILFFIFT